MRQNVFNESLFKERGKYKRLVLINYHLLETLLETLSSIENGDIYSSNSEVAFSNELSFWDWVVLW